MMMTPRQTVSAMSAELGRAAEAVLEATEPSTLANGHGSGARLVTIRPHHGWFALNLGAVWEYRELLYFLVWRELKVRYKQAAIGAAWAIVQPVIALIIFTAVFGYFARIPSDGLPYSVFALVALLPWTYFAEAMRRAATGLVDDADLVRKIYFPRLIIPLAAVSSPLVDLGLSFTVLAALMAWHGIAPTWNVLYLPLFLLLAQTLALAVGLWLGPINVRFRDVKHTLPLMVQIWMYASPVVYPSSLVPETFRWVYALNPMVGVIEGCRWALLGTARPDMQAIGISATVIVCMLAGGVVFFRKSERSFADVI
jgi:lipopolysaccharide transport system permease protein